MEELPKEIKALLKKQKYHIVGHHSGIKKCRWTHLSLVEGRTCYKEKFYGVKSHRCMQISPSLIWCTHSCRFCWRIQPQDIDFYWKQTKIEVPLDDPKTILDGCVHEWRRILSGYKPTSHESVSWKKWEEANDPFSVAISLSGEPLLYPRISDLILECKRRDLITFLVSNGTLPDVLAKIEEPDQLYVSLIAPDKESYKSTCRPLISDGWERFNQTLESFNSLKSRTVLRLTLVDGLNLKNPEGFARLIDRANPTFVEAKAYMFLGFSRKKGRQLTLENMPSHEKIREFAKEIAVHSGYEIVDESIQSRVVLLSKSKNVEKFS
ncbi:MAG: 4-demethylwyosine synthase TYW1 [Candidatus Helarchaeota archaeon]